MSQRDTEDDRSFEHDLAGKYLTFLLKEELYGITIRPIDDIIEMQDYTKVPQTADYVRGVINLRGSVIPIIDLREKFGMETTEYDRETCIVVVTIDDFQTGLIVDEVREVAEFSDEQIDPAPSMGHEVEIQFVAGMGKSEDTVTILLDLERILEEEEKEELREVHDEE
jgi:purine-binding chemotaxis protein CheW